MKSVKGVYRKGRVELLEVPQGIREETDAVVTFLPPGQVDLRQRGVDELQAAGLRARLARFAEEWESPEMDAYDDYEQHRTA